MKTQKDSNALRLIKKDIAELNAVEMKDINGGFPTSIIIETIIRVKTYGTWIDYGPL